MFGEGLRGKSIRGWVASAHVRSSPNAISNNDEEAGMKALTKRTQIKRPTEKRRATVRIVCYARLVAKLLLVEAARRSDLSLSSFLVLAGLGEAARLKGLHLDEIATGDLERYLRVKGQRPKRSEAL